jgi:hypothetical protein
VQSKSILQKQLCLALRSEHLRRILDQNIDQIPEILVVDLHEAWRGYRQLFKEPAHDVEPMEQRTAPHQKNTSHLAHGKRGAMAPSSASDNWRGTSER